ncbi:TPA: hypothetical protein ACRIDK_001981 [Legionella anisa]
MSNKDRNTKGLKEAIAQDIETLKTLEVDIMASHEYYQANLHLFRKVFLKLYGTILLGFILPIPFQWLFQTRFWQDIKNESIWALVKGYSSMALLALGLCVFAFLFLYSSLTHYVLIDRQLKDKLRTGQFLVEKIRMAGTLAYRIFALIVLVPALFLPPGFSLFLAIGALFASGLITGIVVEMELNRIGISTLFTLVKSYFDSNKKPNHDLIKNN